MGPLAVFELKGMLEGGEISGGDLAWVRDDGDWRPLRDIESLRWIIPDLHGPPILTPPPGPSDGEPDEAVMPAGAPRTPPPDAEARPAPTVDGPVKSGVRGPGVAVETAGGMVEMVSPPRPWPRFWARLLDSQLIWMLVVGIGRLTGEFKILGTTPEEAPGLLFLLSITMAWAMIESFALSNWGTTPGKAILGIRVCHKDGSRPGYRASLQRSFMEAFFGWGLGLTIVMVLAWVISYFRLRQSGITVWDERTGLVVAHRPITNARILLYGVVFLLVGLVLMIMLWPELRVLQELQEAAREAEEGAPGT